MALNQALWSAPIGPSGSYGEVSVAFVNGKLQAMTCLSPAGIMNIVAAKVQAETGSAIPAEVATFLEGALGLS